MSSQQLPFVYTTTTVTTDDLEEFTEPVYDQAHQEQFAANEITEKSAEFPVVHEQVIVQAIPCVVGSLPPVDGFTAPVFAQVHQEQLSASEMTVDIAEFPVVHQQVIAGMRPERLVDARRPQRSGRSSPSVGAPVLAVQSLRGIDGVDNTAAKFLLQQTLKKKKEDEEEERRKRVKEEKAEAEKAAKEKVREERRRRQRRQALEQEFLALLDIPAAHRSAQQAARLNELVELDEAEAAAASSSSQPVRRKRKKKRKRKLPKSSSGRGRPRGHTARVPAVLRVPGASVSVPRQSVGHSCYATETDSLCSPWVGCHAPVVVQRQVLWWSSFLCFSYFRNAWYDRGYMYCVSDGGFLDDFPTSFCEGEFRPCGLPGLVSMSLCNERCPRTLSVRSCRPRRRQRWFCWFCWSGCTSRCIQFVCWQAQDLLNHGLYGQVALHLPVELPQVQFLDKVVNVLVMHVVLVLQVQVVILTCFLISWCRSLRRQSRFHCCCVSHDKSLTWPLLSTTDARWFRQCRKLWSFMAPTIEFSQLQYI